MPDIDLFQVNIAPLARTDLIAIGDHIAEDSPENAERWVATLTEAIRSLARMPARFRLRDDLRIGYRVIPVGEYLIFYRVSGQVVEIARVIHGARDIDATFEPR